MLGVEWEPVQRPQADRARKEEGESVIRQGRDHQPDFLHIISAEPGSRPTPTHTQRHTRRRTDTARTLSWPVSHFPLGGLIPLLSETLFLVSSTD